MRSLLIIKDNVMPRPKEQERDYTTVSLPLPLINRIDEYVKRKDAIYKSRVDFTLSAIRKLLDEFGMLMPTPVLEHFNIDEHQGCVRVMDRAKEIIADVYFSYKGVKCEACDSQTCEHVKYVLGLPRVLKKLRKHGWEIEDGEIIRKP